MRGDTYHFLHLEVSSVRPESRVVYRPGAAQLGSRNPNMRLKNLILRRSMPPARVIPGTQEPALDVSGSRPELTRSGELLQLANLHKRVYKPCLSTG